MDEKKLQKYLNPTQDELYSSFKKLADVSELLQEKNYVENVQFFGDLFTAFTQKISNTIYPESIESNYTGIHLGSQYEEFDLTQMIEGFYRKQLLHAKYICQIIKDARRKLKLDEFNKNIRECNLNYVKTDLQGVIIVGDLHGNFKDLYHIIQKYGLPGKNYRFVFNGDFVDRGEQQIEVLTTLLYSFILYPRRVFLNRGNHEDKLLCSNPLFEPCFKTETIKKYGMYGPAIFTEATKTFPYLSIATIVTNLTGFKLFVVHGGISDRIDLNKIRSSLDRTKYETINLNKNPLSEQLCDLLWSDPDKNLKGCRANSIRGIGKIFGEDVTKNFCSGYGFNYVIRSHEARDEGHTQDHSKLFTIFSCSNYNGKDNRGAVMIINNNGEDFKVHVYRIEDNCESSRQKERNRIILTIKKFLKTHSKKLMNKFSELDKENKNYISIYSWANTISTLLSDYDIQVEPEDVIRLRNFLCPIDDEKNRVFYEEMLKNIYDDSIDTSLYFLKIIFKTIDSNGDKRISLDEARKAIRVINELLKKNYDVEFFISMDKNNDGFVDYDEFKKAFLKVAK